MSSLINIPPVAESPHGQDMKARIMSEAIRLFCEKGYQATSVREIVDATGVTKPTLYYYFKNKEDLFRIILSESMEEHLRRLSVAANTESLAIEETLLAIAQMYIDNAQEFPNEIRFMHSVAFTGIYQEIYDFFSHYYRVFHIYHEVMVAGQASGEIRDDMSADALGRLFMDLNTGNMRYLTFCPQASVADVSADETVRLFMAGARRAH